MGKRLYFRNCKSMGDFPEYFHTYVGGGGNHDSPFCVFDAQQKEMLGGNSHALSRESLELLGNFERNDTFLISVTAIKIAP